MLLIAAAVVTVASLLLAGMVIRWAGRLTDDCAVSNDRLVRLFGAFREEQLRYVRAVKEVRELHQPIPFDPGWCSACGFTFPCRTLRVLDEHLAPAAETAL